MSEDSMMEKKSANRSSQPQSRPSAVDCKKSSELTYKPWPRNTKKRESPSANGSKNEPQRKNGPTSRGRGPTERRVRSRAFDTGGAAGTGIAANDELELGSVFVSGSKKQNMNHLLNFVCTPRGMVDRIRRPQPRRNQLSSVKRHNHDSYLQASCQFVVKDGGDYSLNMMDPDKLIDWNLIEEIVVRSYGPAECPICLGAPVAGRVGRCGHVHCWACALHYVESHDKRPPPCPVCAAPFKVDQFKPARILQWEAPGEEVCMRLVRRLRGSTVVEVAPPRGHILESPASILPIESIKDSPFAKLFGATHKQVQDILERERIELTEQIFNEIDTTEIAYIEQALALLKSQEEKVKIEQSIYKEKEPVSEGADEVKTVYENKVEEEKKIDWFDVNEDGEAASNSNHDINNEIEDLVNNFSNLNPEAEEFCNEDVFDNETEFPLLEASTSEDLESTKNIDMLTDIDKENKSKYFYFYQASDGQQVFLDGLNVRVLNASWGALSAAPLTIRGRVLRRETSSLTEQIRKRMPCAAHLPIHCPFDIVELDLKPPHVTTSGLQMFSVEIERRACDRLRMHQRERRREHAYKRQMEGPPKPDLTSEIQFPPTSPPSHFCLPELPLSASATSAVPAEIVQSASTSAAASSPTGLSFAKMASSSGTWRVRTVRPPTPPPVDDDEPAAPRALVLSDAIEAALHATTSTKTSKGRNKKSKQKVLFSTGMQRTA